MANPKIQTYVSILSGGMGASVTKGKRTPRKKMNMNSPAMSPPRKDQIPNQDIHRLITKKYPSLPPIKEKYPFGFKPIFNDAHDPKTT